ncbi:MAG: glucose-1-phosphate cytidylyltransferase [Parachlamydiales bacterium]|nr:glucose-1-phosphate cytidylyltransferase [Parachlamydiales bacterium]
MTAVILAGGLGTRISEETAVKPKPMVEIGGNPIIWHIMKSFSYYGINHFVICLGYKGEVIKEYFLNYYYKHSDLHVDMKNEGNQSITYYGEPWQIDLIETGSHSQTGGRLKMVQKYVKDQDFYACYGDGLSDVDFVELMQFHKKEGRIGTMTVVEKPDRFGKVHFKETKVIKFEEKPENWINAGIYAFNQKIFSYISGPETVMEKETLPRLTNEGQLSIYHHKGFWQCMDTLHEKRLLEKLWNENEAHWKKWKDDFK